MTKWMILRQTFMSTMTIVKKGFIDEETAQELADEMNDKLSHHSRYLVQAYETESVIDMESLNIKLKL